MNKKTVVQVLKKKHAKFVESITDEAVRELVKKNSIITGGCIASLLLNEKVNDYDYYFTDKETCLAVARYYVNVFTDAHPECTIKPKVEVTETGRIKIRVQSVGMATEEATSPYKYFEAHPQEEGETFTEQATAAISEADEIPAEKMEELGRGLEIIFDDTPVGKQSYVRWMALLPEERDRKIKTLNDLKPGDRFTLWPGMTLKKKEPQAYRPIFMTSNAITLSNRVQLITRFYGDAEAIHENYDFVHCTNYWLSSDEKLYLNQPALESLLSRTLYYVGSLYPVSSVVRTRKFLKRGWHINAGQYLKMCFQISELDLKDIETLEDQLTGVDCAYFHQIIDYFKEKMEKDAEFKITMPYLATIVDKIF